MKKSEIVAALVLILIGVATRTFLHLGANIEFITAIAITAGYIFKETRKSLVVILIMMLITDLIIGNTIILLFTWSGFLFPVLIAKVFKKFTTNNNGVDYLKLGIAAELSGIIATLFFYVWTNFGHWLTTPMYTKDLSGLINSYINALPFLRVQLGANLLIVPAFVMLTVLALNLNYSAIFSKNTKQISK